MSGSWDPVFGIGVSAGKSERSQTRHERSYLIDRSGRTRLYVCMFVIFLAVIFDHSIQAKAVEPSCVGYMVFNRVR